MTRLSLVPPSPQRLFFYTYDTAYWYYASGRTPTSWFADNADSPDVPGATCTSAYATEMADTDIGMLCFDAACAPPNARAFSCALSSS